MVAIGTMRRARRLAGPGWLALLLALTAAAMIGPAPASAGAKQLTRYSIVHGCFALRPASGGGYVAKSGGAYVLSDAGIGAAEPFRMQATDLGRYLFYGTGRDFLALAGSGIASAVEPSDDSDWTVDGSRGRFTIVNGFAGRAVGVGAGGALVSVAPADATAFQFVKSSGCPEYPEVEVNAVGGPARGSPSYGEVSGLLEGHLHGMAFEFLGGRAHCGKPWDRFGAPYALRDCPDHATPAGGCAAVLENVLYGNPARCHDPVGWPTFKDWPDPKSLTHEQTYYKWIERAWRGGLRVYVNLMVENRALCEIYPYKQNSCNEMESVLKQIKDIHAMQDYIDAQSGGPGKGFFRIVSNPFQARKVINKGKLAVVQGMEVSEPFGCGLYNDVPKCGEADIDGWLDRLKKLGLRQFEIVNKFDNALTGVAADGGTTGTITNTGNFYTTGRYFDMEHCDDPENSDRPPTGVEVHNEDLIISNGLAGLLPPGAAPVYPEPPLCNARGLSPLGEYAIRKMMREHMIFDPDHMSVRARAQALNLVESQDYSGIISSHSWSTPNTLPRIYRLGGIVTPYAGDSTSFVDEWRVLRDDYKRVGKQYFGVGYGADMNGFGAQGDPRGAGVANPVTYPFPSFDGKVQMFQQQSGERVFDINTDGVAHYGLYPDWIQDLRMIAGNKIVHDMGRGAEAYLQMWERAEGIKGVRCDTWRQRFLTRRGLGSRIRLGDRPRRVLQRSGQPVQRTRTWRWCARSRPAAKANGGKPKKKVVAVFNRRGRVALVGSTLHKHRADGIRPGMRASELRGRARSVGGGTWVRSAGAGRRFAYGVRGGRVRYVALVAPGVSLHGYLHRAGLR